MFPKSKSASQTFYTNTNLVLRTLCEEVIEECLTNFLFAYKFRVEDTLRGRKQSRNYYIKNGKLYNLNLCIGTGAMEIQ